ncbi:MAG TPA: glycine zipper 2TM domain-containing protein [Pseudomonas sp.]|nr:glycine zipper 2TM domain-containing protein [Pseudomonas sp.]
MTTIKRCAPLLGAVALLTLSACTVLNPPAPAPYPQEPYQGNSNNQGYYNDEHGVVTSIEATQAGYQGIAGTGFGLGTVAGAVIGGVAGNQVGKGSGNTAATIAGSAGGAYIGHQLEKRRQAAQGYNITIRMGNGAYQTLTQASTGGLRVGDRVRLENGVFQRY